MGRTGLEEIKETQKLPGRVPLVIPQLGLRSLREAEQGQLPGAHPRSAILRQSSELNSKTTPFFDTSPRPSISPGLAS